MDKRETEMSFFVIRNGGRTSSLHHGSKLRHKEKVTFVFIYNKWKLELQDGIPKEDLRNEGNRHDQIVKLLDE